MTDLDFTGGEADYRALQAAVDAGVPTVAVPKLDRPLVLTNVVDRASAVLANYGVSDTVLMQTIAGQRRPGGSLPFELPPSMAAVRAQLADVPDDSFAPLFPVGYGLEWAPSTIASLTSILQSYRDSRDVRGPLTQVLAANLSARTARLWQPGRSSGSSTAWTTSPPTARSRRCRGGPSPGRPCGPRRDELTRRRRRPRWRFAAHITASYGNPTSTMQRHKIVFLADYWAGRRQR